MKHNAGSEWGKEWLKNSAGAHPGTSLAAGIPAVAACFRKGTATALGQGAKADPAPLPGGAVACETVR